jgi:hypothetical protein
MRTLSRLQHAVSKAGSVSGLAGDKVDFFAGPPRDDRVPNRYGNAIGGLRRVGAPQPTHEPYRHTGPSTQQWYCRRRAGFPRLVKSWVPEC